MKMIWHKLKFRKILTEIINEVRLKQPVKLSQLISTLQLCVKSKWTVTIRAWTKWCHRWATDRGTTLFSSEDNVFARLSSSRCFFFAVFFLFSSTCGKKMHTKMLIFKVTYKAEQKPSWNSTTNVLFLFFSKGRGSQSHPHTYKK